MHLVGDFDFAVADACPTGPLSMLLQPLQMQTKEGCRGSHADVHLAGDFDSAVADARPTSPLSMLLQPQQMQTKEGCRESHADVLHAGNSESAVVDARPTGSLPVLLQYSSSHPLALQLGPLATLPSDWSATFLFLLPMQSLCTHSAHTFAIVSLIPYSCYGLSFFHRWRSQIWLFTPSCSASPVLSLALLLLNSLHTPNCNP